MQSSWLDLGDQALGLYEPWFEPYMFLGVWADSLGHIVHVMTVGPYLEQLCVTLTKAAKPEMHLRLRYLEESGWTCGKSVLDVRRSSLRELHWWSPDRRISVWARV